MAQWDWDLQDSCCKTRAAKRSCRSMYVGEPTRLHMHHRLVLGIGEMRLGCIHIFRR